MESENPQKVPTAFSQAIEVVVVHPVKIKPLN
jgi:hypothetical protein